MQFLKTYNETWNLEKYYETLARDNKKTTLYVQ